MLIAYLIPSDLDPTTRIKSHYYVALCDVTFYWMRINFINNVVDKNVIITDADNYRESMTTNYVPK